MSDLGWIAQAKREATRQKRIAQMLDALAAGDRYVGMEHRAAAKAPARKAWRKGRGKLGVLDPCWARSSRRRPRPRGRCAARGR